MNFVPFKLETKRKEKKELENRKQQNGETKFSPMNN